MPRNALRHTARYPALVLIAFAGLAHADNISRGAAGANVPTAAGSPTGFRVSIGQVELGRAGREGVDGPGEWFWDDGGTSGIANNGIWDGDEVWIDLDGDGAYSPNYQNFHADVSPRIRLTTGVYQNPNAGQTPLGESPARTARLLRGPNVPPAGYFLTLNQYTNGYAIGPNNFPGPRSARDAAVSSHATEVASVMIGQDENHLGVAPNARIIATSFGYGNRPGETLQAALIATQQTIFQIDPQTNLRTKIVNHS